MNREFKFRVWNIKKQGWYNVNVDYLLSADNALLNGIFTRKDLIFQQFTGLKDRNEIEVFEGDIVRICISDSPEDPEWKLGQVIYRDGSFRVMSTNENRYDEPFDDFLLDFKLDLEVVDNIFENKELLDN